MYLMSSVKHFFTNLFPCYTSKRSSDLRIDISWSGENVEEEGFLYISRIDIAIPTITNGDYTLSVQRTTTFHADVLALQDMTSDT